MPKKNIEENIDNREKESIEFPVEPVFDLKESEEVIEEIEKSVESKPTSDKFPFTILRVDSAGFYGIDSNGSGTEIAIPEEYKNKKLKAGDIIYISKS